MKDGQVFNTPDLIKKLKKAQQDNVLLVIIREVGNSEKMRFENIKEAIDEVREYDENDKFEIVKVFY